MLDSSDFTNAIEFMDTFKLNLYSSEIFVFTPKGDIHKMPAKSTVRIFRRIISSLCPSLPIYEYGATNPIRYW